MNLCEVTSEECQETVIEASSSASGSKSHNKSQRETENKRLTEILVERQVSQHTPMPPPFLGLVGYIQNALRKQMQKS